MPARGETCALRLFRSDGAPVETLPMSRSREERDVFALDVAGIGRGARYRYVLDGEELTDPFARWLPDGLDAPASVVSLAHAWAHPALGLPRDLSIYELHVGTFTTAGTYRAASERLRHLAELGVTAVELMPIAAFAGRRGWGYDGVAHYAPFAPYGSAEELAAFVDEAHGLGLAVILDVVYNHFGPRGNTLQRFVPEAFTSRAAAAWGESPNLANEVMRSYVLGNVRYWLEDFRFDGLRLDATQTILDEREPHVLAEIARIAHEASPPRFIIAEDDRNDAGLVRDLGLDGVWADDLHHQIHVALTGESDGYYAAYRGKAADIARTIDGGWFYAGQGFPPRGKPRGTASDGVEAAAFVHCIQNHDQVGNRPLGDRLTAAAGIDAFAAAALVLLTLPSTPLLFMGQEWAATAPFLYFTNHDPELGRAITEGRRREFAGFAAFADAYAKETIPDPQAESTFARSRLDWAERGIEAHARVLELHRALLRLRRTDPVLRDRARSKMRAWNDGELLVVDRTSDHGARCVIANFTSEAQPLAPEVLRRCTLLIASRDAPVATDAQPLPPHTAALFARTEASRT